MLGGELAGVVQDPGQQRSAPMERRGWPGLGCPHRPSTVKAH